jgi:hypothetical protein
MVSWFMSGGHLGVSHEGAENWWRLLKKVVKIVAADLL